MAKIEKNEQVLVSVVVPVYNAEQYLEACINSLLGQTYQMLEILLIDDGSTDGSLAVCRRYEELSKGKVRVIHKENGGVSSARNLGMILAKGTYLIFVDADDQIHREMIEIYMEAEARDQVLLCEISNITCDLEKDYSTEWRENVCIFSKDCFMELFVQSDVNSPCNKLYHTDILKNYNIQFPEDLSLGEDLIFNLQYFRYAPEEYKLIRCPLYCYQDAHEGSLTNDFRRDLFEIQLRLFRELQEFLETERVWNEENQKIYYQIFWDRLYLTVRIYLNYIMHHREKSAIVGFKNMLRSPVWTQLEQECKKRDLMTWKRVVKKWHVYLLRCCMMNRWIAI